MKRLALVGVIALAVAVGFFVGTRWVRNEGNGWVMWKKTVEFSMRQPQPVVRWEPTGSVTSLPECDKMVKDFAAVDAMVEKESDVEMHSPKLSVEYKEGNSHYTVSGGGGYELTTYYECYPGTFDPRPRR